MGRRNVSRPRVWRVGVAIALLAGSACSGSDDGDAVDDTAAADSAESDQPASSVATDDSSTGDSSTGDEDGSTDASEQPTGPLGFATDVFDITIPADADPEFGAFENSNELIDAGIDAGVWTEVEGVRALVSVVMGELPPEAVPAIAELPRLHYSEVIERAIGLLDDPTVDEDQVADLERLTAFFRAERLDSPESEVAAGSRSSGEGASGSTPLMAPVGLRRPSALPPGCGAPVLQLYKPQEETLFGAEPTPQQVCYERFEDGPDVVYVAALAGAIDISSLVFDVIRRVRPGYAALAGEELQPVEVLVSINPSPPDMRLPPSKRKRGANLAHVASAVGSVCRVAIFASDTLTTGTPHLEFTIAHELFHCIQGLWNSGSSHEFITEAGADYFAYEVLDRLCTDPQEGLGTKLDTGTTNGSLLDVSYEGWFFWAFLAERGYVAPQLIAQAHHAIYDGAPIEESVLGVIQDPPKVLNEFFVRLVGPGLACDFKGSAVTGEIPVKDKGPVKLEVREVWHGTRYRLNYDEKKLFEQSGDDAGPIGMAEFAKRGDEGEWVITEPEVRTTCDDEEQWMVVVSPAAVGVPAPRKLEVDEVEPGGCDPCLIGSWSVDMDSFQERYNTRSPIDVKITGSYRLTFEPGPPVGGLEFTDREDILIEFPDFGVTRESAGGGTYTAVDNQLQSQGYLVSGVGQSIGLPINVSSPFAAGGDAGAPYVCDGDDLTIVFGDASLDAVRDPATPQGIPYFD